ncbi:MAG: hypothetical protein QXO67_03975 [Candidatus Bathyarchaeia archaeon]
MEVKNGVRRVVWMPYELDDLAERTRKRLGLTRSGFFRYAVTQLLQQLSVLSTTVKGETIDEQR